MAWLHSHQFLITAVILTLVVVSNSNTLKMETSNIVRGVEGKEMPEPSPTKWPDKFHASLVMNDTTNSNLSVTNLWYDWPNGLNVNLIQYQFAKLAHNVEWNNGTQFYYTLRVGSDGGQGYCITNQYEVGIPRPDWMRGGIYLGQTYVDGFLCNVWNKIDFIWYYEDVLTKRPVQWYFFTGLAVHVVTFEVGVVLERSKWEPPFYCFDKQGKKDGTHSKQAGLLISPVAFV